MKKQYSFEVLMMLIMIIIMMLILKLIRIFVINEIEITILKDNIQNINSNEDIVVSKLIIILITGIKRMAMLEIMKLTVANLN